MRKRLVLIDGDMLPYECGELRKKPVPPEEKDIIPHIEVGDVLPFEFCWGAAQNKIQHILDATGSDDYLIYLSSQYIKTWRFDIATILPYKGKRKGKDKPVYWDLIRKNLKLHYKTCTVELMEADDAISSMQYKDYDNTEQHVVFDNSEQFKEHLTTIIATRDKDLDMVPGWHFRWGINGKLDETYYQDKIGGLRCFYKQLLTGDSVDNVLGLYGVGNKAACVKRLQQCDHERDMFIEVWQRYKERFGEYAKKFLIENGQLLWMQRTQDDRWNPWEEGNAQEWLS